MRQLETRVSVFFIIILNPWNFDLTLEKSPKDLPKIEISRKILVWGAIQLGCEILELRIKKVLRAV